MMSLFYGVSDTSSGLQNLIQAFPSESSLLLTVLTEKEAHFTIRVVTRRRFDVRNVTGSFSNDKVLGMRNNGQF